MSAISSKRALSLVRSRVGHRADELVTAVAHHRVVGAQVGADHLADQGEELVAGQMSVVVVDLLETVDVDEHEREAAAPCDARGRARG